MNWFISFKKNNDNPGYKIARSSARFWFWIVITFYVLLVLLTILLFFFSWKVRTLSHASAETSVRVDRFDRARFDLIEKDFNNRQIEFEKIRNEMPKVFDPGI